MGPVSQLLHHGNRQRTGGHRIRDGTAGDRAHGGRGQYAGLGRSATKTACRRKRQVNEKFACARALQEGTE